MVPSPWPELSDVNVIHATGDVAVHEHSRETATVMDEVPPAAGKELAGVETLAWQRGAVGGVVRVVDAELPHATAAPAAITANSRGTRCVTPGEMQKSRPSVVLHRGFQTDARVTLKSSSGTHIEQ